jgi:acyl-CoA reductase-like NAD-dependent aldehyde dehydrogenase
MQSINPETDEIVVESAAHSVSQWKQALATADRRFHLLSRTSFVERASLLKSVADQLDQRAGDRAALMAREMGESVREGCAEAQEVRVTVSLLNRARMVTS